MSPDQQVHKINSIKTVDSSSKTAAAAVAMFDANEARSAVASVVSGVDLFTRYEPQLTS